MFLSMQTQVRNVHVMFIFMFFNPTKYLTTQCDCCQASLDYD